MTGTRLSRFLRIIPILLVTAVLCPSAYGKVIYVDDDARPAPPRVILDGSSWRRAYRYIQDALADARNSDKPVEIRVAQGTYRPDEDTVHPDGTGDRTASFRLINGVTIRGGFGGFGEPDPDAQVIDLYETILSGDLEDNDVAVESARDLPSQDNRQENSYHVVMGIAVDETAMLEGCTITGGNADDSVAGHNQGGGMYLERSSPKILYCTFVSNSAEVGGALYNISGGSPLLQGCTLRENWASYAGAIWNGYTGHVSKYADELAKPAELAFDPNGSLYVGSSPREESVYRIAPGGGAVSRIEGPTYGSPVGLDVDCSGVLCLAYDMYMDRWADVWKKRPRGPEPEFLVRLLRGKSTSLVADCLGRRCERGAILVAVHEIAAIGQSRAVIICVPRSLKWYELYSPNERPTTEAEYSAIVDMCFDDVRGSLWYLAGGGRQGTYLLYEWAKEAEQPRQVPLRPESITGDLRGLAFHPYDESLIVGLKDERRIIKVSLDGQVLEELARGIDPRSITVDAEGNVYVSDDVSSVIWKISPTESGLALVDCTLSGNEAEHHSAALQNYRADVALTNCILAGNRSERGAATGNVGSQVVLTNCTFYGNRAPNGSAVACWAHDGSCPSEVQVSNCILWDDDPESWNDDGSSIVVSYSDVRGGWDGAGVGNTDIDPCLARPGYWWDMNGTRDESDDVWVDEGDYHLKSETGRWDLINESWVMDDVTSPCIDAGDPNSPVAFEPFPNGGVINTGAYGGTREASKSPSGLHAKYGGGTGEPNDPYLIHTAEHLNAIGTEPNDWDKHFKLMADINLSGLDAKAGRPAFNVIGSSYDDAFAGVFDGQGHTVRNLTLAGGEAWGLGLFGFIGRDAEVRNLAMRDANVEGGAYVGSLVGYNNGGTVRNCRATGHVRANQYTGGLIGICTSGALTQHCHSETHVSGGLFETGGLVGANSHSTISECSAAGVVEGHEETGGITGRQDDNSLIRDCYSACQVSGEIRRTGGIVGRNRNSVVSRCYSVGSIIGNAPVGGLVAWSIDGEVEASFWDIETSGQATSAGGTGLTTSEMQTAHTFLEAGWDFVGETKNGTEDIWRILEGRDYPRLRWELGDEASP